MIQAMRNHMSEALQCALDTTTDPSMAAADWLARDIDPERRSAVALLTNTDTPLEHLIQAKDVFKTMRIVGETVADRRLGARLYLAAIAAALVRHNSRISRQSDAALRRALLRMQADRSVPDPLRHLMGLALCIVPGRG